MNTVPGLGRGTFAVYAGPLPANPQRPEKLSRDPSRSQEAPRSRRGVYESTARRSRRAKDNQGREIDREVNSAGPIKNQNFGSSFQAEVGDVATVISGRGPTRRPLRGSKRVPTMSIGRFLVITADDFGIGPETSHGILDLAGQGLVTATVLLVNSPHAEAAVHTWRISGIPLEVGWHPCLTLDRPVSPPGDVRSLVDADGRFWPLGRFLFRLLSGRVRADDVARELHAQIRRFRELVGHSPSIVNTHHHVQVFPPLDAILVELLGRCPKRPYVRRVREPWRMLSRIPGARRKRAP